MNIVMRKIAPKDLATYQALAKEAPIGFTTLPKDPKLCEENLEHSVQSFEKEVVEPDGELYLFVAEDCDTHEVIGVSGLYATTGGKSPLYYFRQEYEEFLSTSSSVVHEQPILTPVTYARGPTELCSLFVPKHHRHSGVGKLLSHGRFLYMKAHDIRFTNTLFAELRGKVDDNKTSPFWEHVGRHFFAKSYEEVLEMLQYGKAFFSDFLPKHPLYTKLLAPEAQACIGEVDRYTEGAYSMLEKLGFSKSLEVDILDAGPRMMATKDQVTILNQSKLLTVSAVSDEDVSSDALISTTSNDFRACYSKIHIDDTQVVISQQAADTLHVSSGDTLICYRYTS